MAISWTPYGGTAFPTFGASDLTWNAPATYQGWGDGPVAIGGDQGSWGITPGVSTPDWFNPANIRFSGAATVKFRDWDDTKDVITASMTGSERTSVTKDVS